MAELAALREKDRRHGMVMEMCAADDMFITQWNPITEKHDGAYPCVLVNDTFYYSCADGEFVPYDLIPELHAKWKAEGHDGLVKWVSEVRGIKPLKVVEKDIAERDGLREKMKKLLRVRDAAQAHVDSVVRKNGRPLDEILTPEETDLYHALKEAP